MESHKIVNYFHVFYNHFVITFEAINDTLTNHSNYSRQSVTFHADKRA